jgi:hypothetical protein
MISASIKEFLKTGRLGPIELGMHQDHMLSLLGEPDGTGTRLCRNRPTLLLYGVIEFYFDEDADFRLTTIHCDDFKELSGGKAIGLNPWILRGGLPLSDLKAALEREGIKFEDCRFSAWQLEGVRTQAGVELGCRREADDDEPLGLCAVWLHADFPSKVVKRQIGIWVPAETYEKIRREAMRRRMGIAQLCSEWVCKEIDRLPDN